MDAERNCGMDDGRLSPDCERAGVLIEKELAGRLTPEENVELSGHLSACGECREYMKDAAQLSGAFASFREEWDELPAAVPRRISMFRRVIPYAAGLAAGVIITAGILLHMRAPEGSEASVRPAVASASPPAGIVGGMAEERLGIVLATSEAGVRGAASVPVGGRGHGTTVRGRAGGLLVEKVTAGSWAENVGVQPGDRLLEVADIVLESEGGRWALDYILKRANSGNRIELLLWRDGVGVLRAIYVVPDVL